MAHSKPLKEKVLGSVLSKSSVHKARNRSRECAMREREDVQLSQVKEKLKEMDDKFRNMDDDQLSEYARELIDKEKMKTKFSHLLQEEIIDAIDRTASDAEAFPGGQIQHAREHQAVRTRAMDRFTRVSHFPVKLLLSRLDSSSRMNRLVSSRPGSHLASMMRMAYGPLHAALMIDDVKVEWNASSLVIPEMVDPFADGAHDFQTEVSRGERGLGARVMERGAEIGATLERDMDFSRQIDLMLSVNADKAALIDRLADVIVRYNKLYYYDPIFRNCQHFVSEAMTALEITDPPSFQGRLREYYDYLRQRKGSAPDEFTTHAELDTYVTDNLDSVTRQEDMEYLHCLYFQFHMQAGMREAENWVCPEDSCKMGELAERIQRLSRSLLIEQFLSSRADGGSK